MPVMGHGPQDPGARGGHDPYGGHPGPGHHGPGQYGPGGPGHHGPGPGGPGGWNEGTTYGADSPGGPQGPGEGPPPHPEAYGPRLPWKELLKGLVLRPVPTLWRMRDYPMWAPALIVSFLYGLVAVFGLDDARQTMLDTTASSVVPYLLITGVAMVCGALLLSTVTHMLARQLGGNGHWAPTVGLAMLIMSLTDVPRLLLAIFLGGAATVVQIVGWVTWLYAGVLLTMMVMRSHELPWQRALPACAIQLLALLMLVKLGTF
ncbi:YIP1 family protein [Streptomyces lonarensis]|uniref:YIP1 family protein n=2 Tax=Streptomyces lonarensis TaxID=700599 RepID=A0A7X6HZK1_9ACTN|nr:YIP1 family protein [Streptomyces lonarensis]